MPTSLSNNIATAIQTTYLDDFNEQKGYYRILFRPSVAVQARELNQLQSILQNQISKYGDYTFSDGSRVDGVHPTYLANHPFVRLSDTFNSNTSRAVTEFDNKYLVTNSTDVNTSVQAFISYSVRGYKANYPDTNRWYLDYVQTGKDGSNNDLNEFRSADTLYVYNTNQAKSTALNPAYLIDTINVITSNSTVNATGYGYGVKVSDGIIYQKGFFSKVQSQIIIVRNYDQSVNNYVIGFETQENIVTENQDASLNDNANGSTNYNAPGAHRLQLTPRLVAKLRSEVSNNFFAIAEFENSQNITQQANNDPTAKLMDTMAQRLYDTNGDFVVNPFTIDSYADSSNSQSFFYQVSTGTAFVKGYEIEKIGSASVSAPRASNTNIERQVSVTANYGSYVIVNQAMGIFNDATLATVAIYDAAQTSMTDKENSSSSATGNIIGYANVRGFEYYSGTKGLYSTQYALYIYNVVMNSGKSFTQARSFVGSSSAGYCRADAVLQGNPAVATLNGTTSSTPVFPLGYSAIKTLVVNGASSSETAFTYRQVSSVPMSNTGVATFSLNTSAPGGTEKLAISAGNYSADAILNQFTVSTNSAVYSANLTGTVSITSGNTTVTGTGTAFTTQLTVGENIRVSNSSTSVVYNVNAIANSTSLTLSQSPGATYATYNFQHYYPEGHIFKLASVNVTAGALSFVANTGIAFDVANFTINGSYPVTKSTATGAKKVANESTFVKIDCSANASYVTGPWDLGLIDVYNVKNIYLGTTYANTNPQVRDWFVIDNGQRDDFYDHAKLYVKPQYSTNITGSSKILIELDHFTANSAAGVGYFSIDSYPIDDANTANTAAIQTAQIPLFQSTSGPVDLRNALDFRPQKYNTATVTSVIASASINPAVSNGSFNITSTVEYMAEPNSNIYADVEYYLGRYDEIVMNKQGTLLVKSGVPSVNPTSPLIENDTMAIAEVYVPPYPSLTIKEGEMFSRKDIIQRVSIRTNKRYTMREIGLFDSRIKRLEYYVTLNALEQQAANYNIPSAANAALNRFKNGIFVDPFNDHTNGSPTDIEYKISIDSTNGYARPYFNTQPNDFTYDTTNSTTQLTGSAVTAPYSHVAYITQSFATKYRNPTESVWQWNGNLGLYPAFDYFVDPKQGANLAINIDTSTPWNQFANSPFGTQFGDWRTTGTSSSVTGTSTSRTNIGTGTLNSTTTNLQTKTVQERTVDTLSVAGGNTTSYDFGNYVSDFSISPYIRSRSVAFVAKNLKPNTKVYAFFDGTPVSSYCAPGILSGTSNPSAGKEDSVVTQNGNYGDQLVSDKDGQVFGIFKIPEGKFRVGDRVFKLCNVSDLTTGANAIITSSTATYSASNLSVTKSSATLNFTQPIISFSNTTANQTLISTSSTVSSSFDPGRPVDPIAQTWTATGPSSGESGIFITKLGLFFESKDNSANNGITVYITETGLGQPDRSRIVAQGRVLSSAVTTSEDSSVETQITLDQPFLATAGKEYAFIVAPDGNSPEWTIWTAETGGVDVLTNQNIYSTPYSGVLFISSNMSGWTAIQKEEIKFNIYRAKFSTGDFYAYFNNENDEYISTSGFVTANSSTSVEVGDIVYSANNSTGTPNTSATAAFGRVIYVEQANGTVYLDSSVNGNFASGNLINFYRVSDPSNTSLISSSTKIANATITSINNIQYQVSVPQFATIEPILTSISYGFKGTDGSYVTDSAYQVVPSKSEYEFLDKSRYLVSKSNEVSYTSGNKTTTYRLTLNTGSEYVSPVVSLTKKAGLFVKNIINNDSTNEQTKYGNATTKYISKTVVLADGQEAEDIQVYLTAYRPVNSDIQMWIKFKNNSDPESFDSKAWTQLSYLNGGASVFSSPSDRSDQYEYQFGVPSTNTYATSAYLDSTNINILTYTNNSGAKFVSYKYFALKIVLLSSDPTRVPILNDVRAIALQV